MAMRACRQLLGVIVHHLHRLAGLFSEKIANRNFDQGCLSAEISAHRQNMDLDFRRVELEIAREPVAKREWRLVRCPDFHAIISAYPHRAGMRLDVGVKTERRTESVLEHPGCFLKA